MSFISDVIALAKDEPILVPKLEKLFLDVEVVISDIKDLEATLAALIPKSATSTPIPPAAA